MNLNWTAVQHGSTAITTVTNAAFNLGGNLIQFSGDTNIFNVVAAVGVNTPTASVTAADVGTLMGLTPGTSGSLTATLNDAKLAVGGAVVFTMANATVQDSQMSAAHAAFATATTNWVGVSSDGATPPISFTRS